MSRAELLRFANEAHRLLPQAAGQAGAFQLLDACEPDPRNELLAAKETGELVAKTLALARVPLWRLRRALEDLPEEIAPKVAEEVACGD